MNIKGYKNTYNMNYYESNRNLFSGSSFRRRG